LIAIWDFGGWEDEKNNPKKLGPFDGQDSIETKYDIKSDKDKI
jgi:hypothetical protein